MQRYFDYTRKHGVGVMPWAWPTTSCPARTGGITDHLGRIIELVSKKTGTIVSYHSNPETLLDELERIYRERILPDYLRPIEGHNPDGVLDT